MTDWLRSIVVFCDGACSGNPGPGGFGSIIALPEGKIIELGAGRKNTTNNRMELLAAIEGLKAVADRPEEVHLFTDSTYLIRGITQWIWGWKKRGWKTAEGKEVANEDLWRELFPIAHGAKKGKIHFHYVRGHTGNPGNERVDEIAVAFTQGRWIDLYRGPLLGYGVAIHDIPEDTSLPEPRAKEEKKAAHSYLSLVNGRLRRHANWAACEAEVKGRSGAKFKKTSSPANELEILAEWGLSEEDLGKA